MQVRPASPADMPLEKTDPAPLIGRRATAAILWWCICFACIKFLLLQHFVSAPTVFHDELIYRDGAESFYHLRGYLYRYGGFIQKYPPLYSLIISPSFAFGENFFPAILLINSVLTSFTLVPLFALVRPFLTIRSAVLFVVIFSLMPLHFFNAYVMAENLLIPLLALLFWVMFGRGRETSIRRYFAIGLLLALSFLTKFLALVLAPIIGAYVLLREIRPASLSMGGKVMRLIALGLGFLIPVVGWCGFAAATGGSVLAAIGVNAVSGGVTRQLSKTANFLPWFAYYSEFIFLALAGSVPLIVEAALSTKRLPRRMPDFLWVLLVSLLVLTVTAAKHSAAALYNQPVPAYLIGRYTSIVFPFILTVLFTLGRHPLDEGGFNRRPVITAGVTALLLIAGFFHISETTSPYFLGTANAIWSTQMSKDFMFGGTPYLILGVSLCAAVGILLGLRRFNGVWFLIALWFAAVSAPHFQLHVANRDIYRAPNSLLRELRHEPAGSTITIALHDLPEALITWREDAFGKLPFFLNTLSVPLPKAVEEQLQQEFGDEHLAIRYAKFGQSLHTVPLESASDAEDLPDGTLLLSTKPCGLRLAETEYAGVPIYVSRIRRRSEGPERCSASELFGPLKILAYGPEKAIAGEPFNRQPDGQSAMWFKTSGANAFTVVRLDGRKRPSQSQPFEAVTTLVPLEVATTRERYLNTLRDTNGDRESNAVALLIE